MFDQIQNMATQQAGAQMFDRFRPQMGALATLIAERERAQLELAQRLAEASEAEVSVEELPDVEERAGQLEAMAEAASQASLDAWYFEEFAPTHLENTAEVVAYAGLDDGEWTRQQAAWAENYRKTSPDAKTYGDRELAALHVENTFGLTLDEFEQNIVDWRPGEAIQDVLTAHLTAVEGVMRAVATDMEA